MIENQLNEQSYLMLCDFQLSIRYFDAGNCTPLINRESGLRVKTVINWELGCALAIFGSPGSVRYQNQAVKEKEQRTVYFD